MIHPLRVRHCLAFAVACLSVSFTRLAAQETTASPLRISGFTPAGVRNSVSERWCELSFSVSNSGPTPRDARVVVTYEGQPFEGYARDLAVPANTVVQSWLSIGPAPKGGATTSRSIQMALYDRTGGPPVLVRPATEERTRDRLVIYRPNDLSMALYADPSVREDLSSFGQPTPSEEALTMLRVLRSMQRLPPALMLVESPTLPATREAFAGVDLIVLANNRLRADALGRAAMRRWVEEGGEVWVMLDQVDPDVVGAILGEEFVPHVVDRTALQRFRLERFKPLTLPDQFDLPPRERPVPFVRVALSGHEDVTHYVGFWPASFVHRLGRGKVLFTTLGPTGWHRPRALIGPGRPAGDPPSPYEELPDLPVGETALRELISDLKPADHPFTSADLRGLLTDEIGYAVPGRTPVAAVLGGFILALIGIAVLIRRSRRTEVVGWLIPAAAVFAAGLFVLFGRTSRQAIPPTIAIAETVEAIPPTGEVARRGLFANYQPDSGPAPIAAPRGGMLDFDVDGLGGQTRLHVRTDQDSWRYEHLSLPAGVRDGAYRITEAVPLSAVAAFGPAGLQGQLRTGTYLEPTDSVVATRGRGWIGARLAADGTFTAGATEVLSPGQFFPGAVLTDRQQRRQAVYRKLLTPAPPPHWGDCLLAWATPTAFPFTVGDTPRATGVSLLVVPIEYRPPPAGTTVRIPHPFLPYQRFMEGKTTRMMPTDSDFPTDLRLRFQLPPSVLPLTLDKAVVRIKIKAAARKVTFSQYVGDTAVPLATADGPLEPVRVEVTDKNLLTLDADGGWHFGIDIGPAVNPANTVEQLWVIESIQLEIEGRTAERR